MNVTFRKGRRRFFRLLGLCFCLALCLMTILLPVSGQTMPGDAANDVKNGVSDAVSDAGDALSDVGDALSEAVTDMGDPSNGAVSDRDGIIGNDSEEMTEAPEAEGTSPMVWIGIAIALAVVAAVIILIIVLVPKKR